MTEPLLCVQNLTKHFAITRGVFSRVVGQVRAVDGVSFEVAPGETLGLVGESGSGKTTVGRCVLGLARPTSGKSLFAGRDVALTLPAERKKLRRELQVIFQDPFSSLNPRFRVADIVGEALEVHGIARGPELERRVATLLERVGLSPSSLHRYPHEFSGGQRQRIGIARAIALSPKLIVCDEAVSALDVSVQAQVINLLIELRRELGIAYLFIAHDLSVVRHLSHRIAAMYLGRLVEVAPSPRLFAAPAHPYTRALLSAIPHPDPGRAQRRLVLAGEIPSPANPPGGCHFHTRCPAVRPRCRQEEPPSVEVERDHTVRCVHALDLPAGGDWLTELSRRIESATTENAAASQRAPELVTAEQLVASQEWTEAWKRPTPPVMPEQTVESERARSRSRDVALGVTALGVVLVAAGHAWVGMATAAAAYVGVARRREARRRITDGVIAAALVVALVIGHRVLEHQRRAQAEASIRALATQIEERAKLTGALPERLSELGWRLYPLFPGGVPRDPWGHPFTYRAPGTDGRRFDLESLGADGVPSLDDVGRARGARESLRGSR